MAASVGRKLIVRRAGSVVAGVRTKTVTANNEPIDVSTDDDGGYRVLLEESASSSIDMSVEGLHKDTALIKKAAKDGETLIETYEIEFPNGAKISGSFRLNSIEEGAEYQDAITFSATIQSTGTPTWTDAP